ncbi:tyrosine-type recombinase/integrase [Bradyrhizobium liaoningense]|uniref:tyrosine-type recombinase/integrase n=1 Tax=Bradyrhizobium liaoningense TaxID=43992 RepID=UPI001BA7985C|nr:tyrosine-type recombinase/integrase [Bradyrhizobium liaoningense]MBR0901220.1 site-specific integrase [Bradyrhizobium liaoningense]
MKGNITRRGNNSWRIKFDIEPNGQGRQTRYVTIRGTKKEAQVEAAKIIAAASKGDYVEGSKETVAQFVERWLRDWAKGNTSNKTYARYEELLRLHVVAHEGERRIQRLRATDLQALYAKLQRETGLAARTVLHVHRVVHRMLRHAAQWGVVHQNAATLVDAPSVPSTEIDILTPAQVQAVLQTLRASDSARRLYTVAAVALGTGMRRGELLALRWQDVDLDAAMVRVERSLEQTKAGLVFKAPKTRHGRRSITLPPSTVSELRTHWRASQERRLALGQGKAPEDALVFGEWDGSPRSPNALTKEWAAAMARAKITATLHSLRHTHASTLIASGLDVLTISRRLGHGSPAITLTVYGHLFKTDDRAAAIMEAAFAGAE